MARVSRSSQNQSNKGSMSGYTVPSLEPSAIRGRSSASRDKQRGLSGKGAAGAAGAYMLNGRMVRDATNGMVIDASTGQPINAATGKNLSPTDIGSVINPGGKTPISGKLAADYKKTESAEFRKAAEAGDPQPQYIREMTAGPKPSAPPNGDPNNTGQSGTQMSVNPGKPIGNMTYEQFMGTIGKSQGVQVANPFLSEQLPGSPGQPATLAVANKQGHGVESEGMDGTQVVDGRIVPKVTLNAAKGGKMSDQLEAQRTMAPGSEQTPETIEPKDEAYGPYFKPNKDSRFEEGAEYGETYSTNDSAVDRRARAAFLDTSVDSLTALRRSEGARGVIAQGGKKFARDPEAEGGLREISQGAYRSRMGGADMKQAIEDNPIAKAGGGASEAKSKAQGYKNENMGYVTSTGAPSIAQNPPVIGEDGGLQVIDNEAALRKAREQRFAANRGKI